MLKYKKLLIISTTLFISSCNTSFKEEFGIERYAPNEYNVTKNQGLKIPESFELTPPITHRESPRSSERKDIPDQNISAGDLEFIRIINNKI